MIPALLPKQLTTCPDFLNFSTSSLVKLVPSSTDPPELVIMLIKYLKYLFVSILTWEMLGLVNKKSFKNRAVVSVGGRGEIMPIISGYLHQVMKAEMQRCRNRLQGGRGDQTEQVHSQINISKSINAISTSPPQYYCPPPPDFQTFRHPWSIIWQWVELDDELSWLFTKLWIC